MSFKLLDLLNFGDDKSGSEIHAAYETWAPQTSNQISYSPSSQTVYNLQIDSPNAVQQTKKEDLIATSQKQEPSQRVEGAKSGVKGFDFNKIALIGVGGLILVGGVMAVSRNDK